jgi:hypothetical protein
MINNKADLFDMCCAIFLFFGMIISYLPQIVKLIKRKDSSSFSSISLFAGMCGCVFIMFSLVIIPPWNNDKNIILSSLLITEFFKKAFPLVQGIIWLVICTLVMVYSPKTNKSWNIGFTVCWFALSIANFIIYLVILKKMPGDDSMARFLNFNFIAGMAFTAFQYFPQIIKIIASKDVEALSPWTQGLQIFGGFITCYNYKKSWTEMGPYAIALFFQIVILILYFMFYKEKKNTKEMQIIEANKDESKVIML